MRSARPRRAAALACLATLVAGAAGAGPATAASPAPLTMRATSLATMQTDGTVAAIAYAAGKVFVGGSFRSVRPAGAAAGSESAVPQAFLAAYDATTGAMISDFRHTLTNTYDGSPGLVRALDVSPDGFTLYVGGDFNNVDGVKADHVAAFSTDTGALRTGFGASGVNGPVYAVAATADAVYVGGTFSKSTYRTRGRLAAFSPTGSVQSWAPTVSGSASTGKAAAVYALETSPDGSSIYAGGTFDTVNGTASHGIAGFDAAGQRTAFASAVPATSYLTDLAADGRQLYVVARDDVTGSPTRFEGVKALAFDTGATNWFANCYGDTFGVQPLGDAVYIATHAHDCTAIGGWPEKSPRHYASVYTLDARDGALLPFDPMMTGSTAVAGSLDNTRAFATDGRQLFVGGGWLRVDGTEQANLARFGPDGVGKAPTKPFATATADSTGAVVVRWRTVDDDDDRRLTYRLYRGTSSTTPIYTATADSTFWNKTGMAFTDAGASASTAGSYRIAVSDEFSRVFSVNTAKVTSGVASATYPAAVVKDGAGSYWRFDDAGSATAADSSGKGKTGTYSGGVLIGQPGAPASTSSSAITLDGRDDRVVAAASTFDPAAFTLESWVKTSSTTGGRLVGLSSSKTGTGSTNDRHLYYTDAGRVTFGVSYLGNRTITSPTAYNDNRWHHVVATQDATGMRLYVDGVEVASDSAVVDARGYTGYWKLGPDNLNGWPGKPTSAGLAASVDEFAVYPVALTPQEVAAHAARR